MKKLLSVLLLVQFIACLSVSAQQAREAILLNNGWKFAYGHAGDMVKDFPMAQNILLILQKQKLLIKIRVPVPNSLMIAHGRS